MRFYFFICLFYLSSLQQIAIAQSYESLLQERQALLEQLEEAKEQTSSILGKKSKKDLRNTTEIYSDIVEKDSEIIAAMRREINRKQQVPQTVTQPEDEQKIVELENKVAQLNNLANQRNLKTAELEQQVATVKDRMFKYQSTILITFFLIFLLTIYISRLRKKNKIKNPA